MHPTTKRNLTRALEREAVAAARMAAYARRAERDGDTDAAQTMHAIAKSDIGHAADIADLLGLVGTLHENVLASVIGDATAHGLNYATLAGEARTVGDQHAAELFRRLTGDETEAAIALLALTGHRSEAALHPLATRSPGGPGQRLVPHPNVRSSVSAAARTDAA